MTVIPKFRFAPRLLTSKTLEIELQKPEPVVEKPAPKPEAPIKPAEPVKPKPIKKEVVKPKVIPKPVVKPIEPAPVETPEPEPEPTPPPVIAASPTPEPPAQKIVAPVVKPAPPPEPPPPSQSEIDQAMGEYGNLLGRAIAKHKAYPKIAVMRGWQGDAMLELKIDREGNVLSAKVHNSSGYEALDKQALEMVKKASPFPKPPAALSGGTFTITVPVSFKLDNG